MTISAAAQKLAPGDRLTFRGIECTLISITPEGEETTSTGPFPPPTVSITNVNDLLNGLLAHNDLLGARFTRLRTFAQQSILKTTQMRSDTLGRKPHDLDLQSQPITRRVSLGPAESNWQR